MRFICIGRATRRINGSVEFEQINETVEAESKAEAIAKVMLKFDAPLYAAAHLDNVWSYR